MLEFNREELQLVAHSNHIPFCSYTIDNSIFYHLESVTGEGKEPSVKTLGAYNSQQEAIREAISIDAMGEGNG